MIYSKIKVVQQQYRQNDKQIEDAVYEPDLQPIPIEPEEEQEKARETVENNDVEEENKQADDDNEQELEQDKQDEEEQNDDRGEECHEDYEESMKDDHEETIELYDAKKVIELQVNSKNKATSLKKTILEAIGLSTKKAQINLYK